MQAQHLQPWEPIMNLGLYVKQILDGFRAETEWMKVLLDPVHIYGHGVRI